MVVAAPEKLIGTNCAAAEGLHRLRPVIILRPFLAMLPGVHPSPTFKSDDDSISFKEDG
jgi:hypothetical protein